MKRYLKKFNLAFVLFLFLISSCDNRKERKAVNSKINKVTVVLSNVGMGCETGCPFEVVRISDDLSLDYFGEKRKGYFRGKITQEIWDSVMIKFNKFLIEGIDSTSDIRLSPSEVEFIIYEGEQKNDFRVKTSNLSDRDLKTLLWFTRKVVEKTNLKPSDSINFGLNK